MKLLSFDIISYKSGKDKKFSVDINYFKIFSFSRFWKSSNYNVSCDFCKGD